MNQDWEYLPNTDEAAMRQWFRAWHAQHPTGGVLALVAEQSKVAIPPLELSASQTNLPLVGTMFPELVVQGMPEHDMDRFGRLRDHLATLAEAANARVHAIAMEMAIQRVDDTLTKTLAEIDAAQRASRDAINLRLSDLHDDLERAFITLGLTDAQEESLSKTFQKGIKDILKSELSNMEVQDKLSVLIRDIKYLGLDESD